MVYRLLAPVFLASWLGGCAAQISDTDLSNGPADPNSPQSTITKPEYDLSSDTEFLIKPSLNNQPSMQMHHGSSEPQPQSSMPQMDENHHDHMHNEQASP